MCKGRWRRSRRRDCCRVTKQPLSHLAVEDVFRFRPRNRRCSADEEKLRETLCVSYSSPLAQGSRISIRQKWGINSMERKHNQDIVPLAKELRKNMTKEERHLWYDYLRNYPVRFCRQKVLGKFIADFYCARAKLVIELDGQYHREDETVQKDADRTAFLSSYGLLVYRIPNIEIHRNFKSVCNKIDALVQQRLEHNPSVTLR